MSGGEAIMEVLKTADINGDQVISYDEFMLSMTDANFFCNIKHLQEAFQKFDKDGNGTISFDEFKKILK